MKEALSLVCSLPCYVYLKAELTEALRCTCRVIKGIQRESLEVGMWYVVCGGRLVRRGANLNGVRVLGASSGY